MSNTQNGSFPSENYKPFPLDIPGQPSGDNGNALGITDVGLVLVNALSSPSNYPDNVDVNDVYNYLTGAYTALPDFPGAVAKSTLANGINDFGEIVGQYDAGGGDLLAFEWLNGHFTSLTPPPGFDYSAALAVSNNGLVTGIASTLTSNFTEGFVLAGGHYTVFAAGPASSVEITNPQSINYAGTVVGTDYSASGALLGSFIYQHGVATPFSVPGWAETAAFGINDFGEIVGTVSNDGFAHSCGFLDDHGVITILQFPNSSQTGASSINDQGVIDGQYLAADGSYKAFLAFPTPGNTGFSFAPTSDTVHAGALLEASLAVEAHHYHFLG